MKINLFFAVLVIITMNFGLFAQEKGEDNVLGSSTKLESFLAKKGKLIVKDSYALGEISGMGKMDLDALIIYEPGLESQKIRGIRVEIFENDLKGMSDTAFLDSDEVESLSKAIAYMTDLASKWSGEQSGAYTEVLYSTKGNFKLGFYHKGTKLGAFASSGYNGRITAYFGVENLTKLKEIIDKGIIVLEQKK